MRPRRYLYVTVLLVILSFTLAQAGSRRPGATAPVGPPPGSVPVAHASNDVSAHLDRTTKHLEQLLKQGDPPTSSSTSSSVSTSTTGVVPGSKPANQSSTPTAPHHLIGDPPLPSSITDLALFNTSPGGSRHPGARPPVYPTSYRPPHHLIGDPPTWPNDLGTYLYSIWDPGDDRGLLPGEINLYTGTLYSTGGGTPFYSQTVYNWNPTTGIGRNVFWTFGRPPDPSQVDCYYYAPPPPPPPPPVPIQNNNTSVPPNPNDPHINLAAGPVNPFAGLLSTQGGDVAISPFSGQSSTLLTAAQSSYVTYYSGSGYPGSSGTGQIASSIGFSPEDFTDDSGTAETTLLQGDVSDFMPDISPVSSQTILAAIVGPNAWYSSGAPSTSGTTPSVQGPAQSYSTQPDAEGVTPIVEGSPSLESEDLSVAQTDSGSSTQGSGSALPWGLGLAGLLIGAGALEGARKAMSWNQDQEDPLSSAQMWIDPSPPSPDHGQRELNLEIAKETYQQETQVYQQSIQDDTWRLQQIPQWLQEGQQALDQAQQKLQEDQQKLQQKTQQLQQDQQEFQQDDQELRELVVEYNSADEQLQEDAELVPEEDIPQSLENEVLLTWDEIEKLAPEDAGLETGIRELGYDINGFDGAPGLAQQVDSDQQDVSRWQGNIQDLQDDQTSLPEDIAQQQANLDAAASNYQSEVQQGIVPGAAPAQESPPTPPEGPTEPGQPSESPPDNSAQQNAAPAAPPAQGDDTGSNQGNLAYQGDPSVPLTHDQGYQDGVAWALDPNRGPGPPLVLNPDYINGFYDGVNELQGAPDDAAFFAGTVAAAFLFVSGLGAAALAYAYAQLNAAMAAGSSFMAAVWNRVLNLLNGGAGAAVEGEAGAQSGLSQAEQAAIRKIYNAIRDHLTPDDISGALRDMMGNPVPKPGGGYYNHFQELTDALQGLRNQAQVLVGVNNAAAQAARQRALDAIQQIENAIQGAGL